MGLQQGLKGGEEVWDSCRDKVGGEWARAGALCKVAKPEKAMHGASEVTVDEVRQIDIGVVAASHLRETLVVRTVMAWVDGQGAPKAGPHRVCDRSKPVCVRGASSGRRHSGR